jgi:hypothetical protein
MISFWFLFQYLTSSSFLGYSFQNRESFYYHRPRISDGRNQCILTFYLLAHTFHVPCGMLLSWTANSQNFLKRQKHLEVNVVSGFWHPVHFYRDWKKKSAIYTKRNISYVFRFSPFGRNRIGFQTPYVGAITSFPVSLYGVATLPSLLIILLLLLFV